MYPEATIECQADGGDLIKVDSQRKMDIFRDFVSKYSAPWESFIRVTLVWHDKNLFESADQISETLQLSIVVGDISLWEKYL